MTALLVEDDSKRMAAIKEWLEKSNITVMTAEDGREALKILHHENNIEVILSDSNLPFHDGFRLAYDVKKDSKLKGIKYLLYSGRQILEDNIAYAKRIGVDFCITGTEPEEIQKEFFNFINK